MLIRLVLFLLAAKCCLANYTFIGPVTGWSVLERGAAVICEGGDRLLLEFVTPEIFRVTLSRAGDPDPLLSEAFSKELASIEDSSNWQVEANEVGGEYELRSGSLIVRVQKSPARLTVRDVAGNVLLCDDSTMSYGWDGNEMRTWKELAPGEKFFGLGLKSGGVDKRGREWQMWNSDIPAYTDNTDPLYQSVPFYIGLRDGNAYGVYFNNSYRSKFNFGAGQQRYASFSAEDGALDYFVIGGPTIADVIQRFTQLTGRISLPPLWSLGYQQSRWSYYPDDEVKRIARTFREKGIPADVIYLDIHYMDGYRVFTWDSLRFPNPKPLLTELETHGFKILPIIDPGVKVDSNYSVAMEGLSKDLFVKYPDGRLHVGEVWPGRTYFPDFSDPKTRVWWGGHIAGLRKLGVRGFWNDMNEPACWGQAFPLETVFYDSGRHSSHKKMHNLYALQMARATYDGLVGAFPNERPFVLTRAGFAGMQRFAASWTGDNVASEDHLELGIRMMLGMGLSGQPFVGTDIGGFMGTPSPELYARWIEVGSLSPFSRTHTHHGSSDQEPWSFGEHVEEISRKFIRFRYELLPHLYTLFREASLSGEPIWRPLFYYDQTDQRCFDWQYQQQFYFGPNILVAPVTREKQYLKKLYLPEGEWLDWNTDRVYSGGREIIADAHLDWLPMFLRAGSMFARRDVQDFADQRPIRDLTLDIFAGFQAGTRSPFQYELYEDDGASFDYTRQEYRVTTFTHRTAGDTLWLERSMDFDRFRVPDRKLTLRWHAVDVPSAIVIDGESLPLNSTLVHYDNSRRLLEVKIASELDFSKIAVVTQLSDGHKP